MERITDVIVIGGGAAGMMAACRAAERGKRVILLEKNEKLGKKIYITGKGRCNVTNDCSAEDFLKNVVSNPKFLTGAIWAFPPEATMRFFEEHGLALKVERGDRVFPQSDHASDVIKTLQRALESLKVDVHLNEPVRKLNIMSDIANSDTNDDADGLERKGTMYDVITDAGHYLTPAVIVATGGISYPSTGSTGDGYTFAQKLGHTIVPCVGGLNGVRIKGNECASMQGLSLKNVRLTARSGNKEISSEFGEMLFTHYGISGPIVLTTSSLINRSDFSKLRLVLDLKPALSEEQLDARLLRDFEENRNKQIGNLLIALLPRAIIPFVLRRSALSSEEFVHSITKTERKNLISAIKNYIMEAIGLQPIEEAIVTAGGVSVKEINPKTMESRRFQGIYFAGEVLDVDAYTGGFNLQIAFATGYAAGNAVK